MALPTPGIELTKLCFTLPWPPMMVTFMMGLITSRTIVSGRVSVLVMGARRERDRCLGDAGSRGTSCPRVRTIHDRPGTSVQLVRIVAGGTKHPDIHGRNSSVTVV